MNVDKLYKITKSIMFEKATSKDYDNYYIENINLVLAENFELNNNLREYKGLEPLETIPNVTQKEDLIPYEYEVNYTVLPYHLASRFFIDDDLAKFNIFNTDYLNARNNLMKFKEVQVRDVYVN
jgi:hypothetical protein